ncbi:hypothetical protein [Sandarakinorhabdus rubra]|uniref:hypothetical protein n=1 Tax=Sandarakinorhabdus rubra TaxID=2672568 RepID=UPI0013DD5D27|nr:hypothetical protein [Sandarakinorhabdus rubra]
MWLRLLLLLPCALLLAACGVAKAIVTAPIAVGEAVYDASTESQEEADIKRGRAMREAEEQAEKDRNRAERAQQTPP